MRALLNKITGSGVALSILIMLNAGILIVQIIFMGAILFRLSNIEGHTVELPDAIPAIREAAASIDDRKLTLNCEEQPQAFSMLNNAPLKIVCTEERGAFD